MLFSNHTCSAMINSQRTAQTVGYAVVLIGFVFQSVLQSGYGCDLNFGHLGYCFIIYNHWFAVH